MIVKDLMWWLY